MKKNNFYYHPYYSPTRHEEQHKHNLSYFLFHTVGASCLLIILKYRKFVWTGGFTQTLWLCVVLKPWSPAAGAVLEGCGTFRRWSHNGVNHWRLVGRFDSMEPFCSLLPDCRRNRTSFTHSSSYAFPAMPFLYPLLLQGKANSSSCKSSRILVTVMRTMTTTVTVIALRGKKPRNATKSQGTTYLTRDWLRRTQEGGCLC